MLEEKKSSKKPIQSKRPSAVGRVALLACPWPAALPETWPHGLCELGWRSLITFPFRATKCDLTPEVFSWRARKRPDGPLDSGTELRHKHESPAPTGVRAEKGHRPEQLRSPRSRPRGQGTARGCVSTGAGGTGSLAYFHLSDIHKRNTACPFCYCVGTLNMWEKKTVKP